MIMAISPIGGVSAATTAAPASATAPADAARRRDPLSEDSIIVISKITKTNTDGSTTTTITYADGHTKVETTPPTQAAAQGEGRVTAVDILV
jgi:hypothetical protein